MIVVVPSPLAESTVAEVPAVQLAPPSRLYSVKSTPLRLSVAVRLTVTSWFWAPDGALSLVTGRVLSITTSCGVTEQRPLPAASTAATQRS